MTIPALLSKMSRRVPRYVTINGLVISGGVTAAAAGHTHPEHGRVTPVVAHRNHGGRVPDDRVGSRWWVEEPQRLEAEVAAMASAFPGFAPGHREGRPSWTGTLNTGRGVFEVELVHRADHSLPDVIPVTPTRLRRREGRRHFPSPHLFVSGNLCVARRKEDWRPNIHDMTVVVAWTAHWLAAYTEWRITGRWNCEGTDVDVA